MDKQPKDVHLIILSFLDQQSLLVIARVNKYYCGLALVGTLYKRKKIHVHECAQNISNHPLCKIYGIIFDFGWYEFETNNIYKQLNSMGCKMKNLPYDYKSCETCDSNEVVHCECKHCGLQTCDNCGYWLEDKCRIVCKKCVSEESITCITCNRYKYCKWYCGRCEGVICTDCQKFTTTPNNENNFTPVYCKVCVDYCTGCDEGVSSDPWICDECLKHYCDSCIDDHECDP